MNSTPSSGHIISQLTANLVQNSQISINIGGLIITTTEDKVRLAAITHLQKIEVRYAWLGPAGVFATISATLLTTSFKDALLPAAVWHALFLTFGFLSLVLTVWLTYRALTAPSIDEFVASLRASDLTSASAESPNLASLLMDHSWVLVFGPGLPQRQSKPISFLRDGLIGEGRNSNENTWRIAGANLELFNSQGEIYSRFLLDHTRRKWVQTRDSETLRARGQYICMKD